MVLKSKTKFIKQVPLTPNEKDILEFIHSYISKNEYSPTFLEIKDRFEFKSFFSVQRYVKQLSEKGYLLAPGNNKKRAIEVVTPQDGEGKSVPLLGQVAAGLPIESLKYGEMVDVPPDMITSTGEFFALQVKGDSMIGDGIMEEDIVIIKKQATAFNGQTVVALIDNEATIKCFYKKKDGIELHSANSNYKPIYVKPDQNFSIEGILHGLIRKFKR